MTFCGLNCCKDCKLLSKCGGCEKCNGHPLGGSCIAERNRDFDSFKKSLIHEINQLKIDNLCLNDMFLLNGASVNLAYELPNGTKAKLLNDNDVYLANQLENPSSNGYIGVVANEDFILVGEYSKTFDDAKIVIFKKRKLTK